MRLADGRYWFPLGTRTLHGRPDVGTLLAYEFAVWRVIRIDVQQEVDWDDEDRKYLQDYKPQAREQRAPYRLWLRPVADTSDAPPSKRRGDICGKVTPRMLHSWDVYPDEHYPVCAHCGGPTPCRWTEAKKTGEQAMRTMARYETAGVCPACQEVITRRQESHTWPDNIEVLGGPPVTFHTGRHACRSSAASYEQRWWEQDPERRRRLLSCGGLVTNHNDGTYDCTEGIECPGPRARHRSYTTCSEPECWVDGAFGCNPAPSAVNRAVAL